MELATGIGSILVLLISLFYGVSKVLGGISADELRKQAEERARQLEAQREQRQNAERKQDVDEASTISDGTRAGDFLRGSFNRSRQSPPVHDPNVAGGSGTDDDLN